MRSTGYIAIVNSKFTFAGLNPSSPCTAALGRLTGRTSDLGAFTSAPEDFERLARR
jgi:hypothetical protein